MRIRTSASLRAWCTALLLGVAAAPPLVAAPTVIPASPTSLTSTAERMISYRFQDHMWQSSDNATHVMINRGNTAGAGSLVVQSTFDGGATWSYSGVDLPFSDATSTSDGFIENDALYVAYSGTAGEIRAAEMRYDNVLKTWALVKTELVFAADNALALTPSLAADAVGRVWLAFTSQDRTTQTYSIKLMVKAASNEAWADTGFSFGADSKATNERSARLVATANGMGMLYTLHADYFWTERLNSAAITARWPRRELVYTKLNSATRDPYGGHFSTVADAAYNLHVATVDDGRVVYLRYAAATKTWVSRPISEKFQATYVQALLSLGNVVIVTNASDGARVFQSSDGGNLFANTHWLVHAAPTAGVTYGYPRVEAPARSSSPIPVLQQYIDGTLQRALFFAVPVVSTPAALPAR